MKLSDICKFIDREYQQDLGQSLANLKQLMAHRLIKFDITQKFKELRVKDFKFYQHQLVEGFLEELALGLFSRNHCQNILAINLTLKG